jgi:hypothetical protein
LRIRLLSDLPPPDYGRSRLPAGNVAVRLSGDFQLPPPDALAPFHKASPSERSRRVRDVLLRAWRVYRAGERSMVDAINDAAAGMAEGEFAKISLRRILLELNLTAWEQHPHRTRRDVHALFRKAINRLATHRGGWRVSR